jgi:NAD+ diphosphatase
LFCKDEDAAERKINRKDVYSFVGEQYQSAERFTPIQIDLCGSRLYNSDIGNLKFNDSRKAETRMNETGLNAMSYFNQFTPAFAPCETGTHPELWFIFSGKQILIKKADNACQIPCETDFSGLGVELNDKQYIGNFDGSPCYCMEAPSGESPCADMAFDVIRALTNTSDANELFRIAGFAYHIMNWNRLNRFCGHCGSPMQDKSDERAKLCPKCGSIVYPRISPATITAVIKGDEILLAHNNSFKDGLYSLVAGFVEPGESLEDCVKREVLEETGVKIKSPKYFGSQPWPFPDSLMLAFTAEYESGEIKADGVEIGDARWFHGDNLPVFPGSESIAGRMIRWYLSTHSGAQQG